jgi:hypothetical protein
MYACLIRQNDWRLPDVDPLSLSTAPRAFTSKAFILPLNPLFGFA